MIVKGSMRYSPSGRKRKTFSSPSKRRVQFMQLHAEDSVTRRETPDYPSAPLTPYKPVPRQDWKVEVSSEYTIAPAYNKGPSMVVGKKDIKDIGR